MGKYERTEDTFIVPDSEGSFGMKDAPQVWQKRAESFNDPQSYLIFARRMELSLRIALGAPTKGREGFGSVLSDLATIPQKFEPVKRKVRDEIAHLIGEASLADCGAGTGSVLSYIEWAKLPYPKQLILLEPNNAYYQFLQQRIEGEVPTPTAERLTVLGREEYSHDDKTEHIVYVVQDSQTNQQSQIQIINAPAQEDNLPVSAKTEAIIFVGVSKYFAPPEFKEMLESAQDNFYGPDGGITAFNTQAKRDLLPPTASALEQIAYKGIKVIKQSLMTGKPTLHNFYGKEDIATFPGSPTVVHNGGDAIIVGLRKDYSS